MADHVPPAGGRGGGQAAAEHARGELRVWPGQTRTDSDILGKFRVDCARTEGRRCVIAKLTETLNWMLSVAGSNPTLIPLLCNCQVDRDIAVGRRFETNVTAGSFAGRCSSGVA